MEKGFSWEVKGVSHKEQLMERRGRKKSSKTWMNVVLSSSSVCRMDASQCLFVIHASEVTTLLAPMVARLQKMSNPAAALCV